MKTFRLIGMALVAVLMCVNFASCSSDDEEEVSNKSLKEMLIGRWDNDDHVFIFDNNTIKWYESDALSTYGSYTVDDNTKIITAYDAESVHAHKFLVMEIDDTKMKLCLDGDGSDPETLTKAK